MWRCLQTLDLMFVGIGIDGIAGHVAEVLVSELIHGETRHTDVGRGRWWRVVIALFAFCIHSTYTQTYTNRHTNSEACTQMHKHAHKCTNMHKHYSEYECVSLSFPFSRHNCNILNMWSLQIISWTNYTFLESVWFPSQGMWYLHTCTQTHTHIHAWMHAHACTHTTVRTFFHILECLNLWFPPPPPVIGLTQGCSTAGPLPHGLWPCVEVRL